jgi:hypothetical protein
MQTARERDTGWFNTWLSSGSDARGLWGFVHAFDDWTAGMSELQEIGKLYYDVEKHLYLGDQDYD